MSPARRPAAYQGAGWRPRRGAQAEEMRSGTLWRAWSVDSEYRPLQAVLLHRPGPELRGIKNPDAAQHLDRIDPAAIGREFDAVARAYRRAGVEVRFLPRAFDGEFPVKRNLMFVRDLFFNTPEGAVLARMASEARAGEEKHAAAALSLLAVPIRTTVSGRGLFEGADALWLDAETVLCGIGGRTNAEGFRQLRATLAAQGVKAVSVPLSPGVQHLLGALQIVDRRLALLRSRRAPAAGRLLRSRGFRVIEVPEHDETVRRQGMNVVALAPRRILMPAGCPRLRALYREAGIEIAAELDIPELLKGAGGLACATGILSRARAR